MIIHAITGEDCPKFCFRNFAPVCGDNGKTYSNECELRVVNCGLAMLKQIKIEHDGGCAGSV